MSASYFQMVQKKMYMQIDGNKAKFQDVNDYSVQEVGTGFHFITLSTFFMCLKMFIISQKDLFIHFCLGQALFLCGGFLQLWLRGSYSFIAAHAVLAEHRLQVHGFQELQLKALHHTGSVADEAQLLHGMGSFQIRAQTLCPLHWAAGF